MKQEYPNQISKFKDIFEFKNYHLIIEITRNINPMPHRIFNKSFAIRIGNYSFFRKKVLRIIIQITKLINRSLLMKNKNNELMKRCNK